MQFFFTNDLSMQVNLNYKDTYKTVHLEADFGSLMEYF